MKTKNTEGLRLMAAENGIIVTVDTPYGSAKLKSDTHVFSCMNELSDFLNQHFVRNAGDAK